MDSTRNPGASPPLRLSSRGRPASEAPILNYSALIGEEYEKRRDAILKYTGGDVARTTKIMDAHAESVLLLKYLSWALTERRDAREIGDVETAGFMDGLCEELYIDEEKVDAEYKALGVDHWRDEEGKWHADNWENTHRGTLEEEESDDDATLEPDGKFPPPAMEKERHALGPKDNSSLSHDTAAYEIQQDCRLDA